MDLTDRPHRQLDDHDRAVGQMLRVENHEVGAAILVGTMRDAMRYPAPSGAVLLRGAKQHSSRVVAEPALYSVDVRF